MVVLLLLFVVAVVKRAPLLTKKLLLLLLVAIRGVAYLLCCSLAGCNFPLWYCCNKIQQQINIQNPSIVAIGVFKNRNMKETSTTLTITPLPPLIFFLDFFIFFQVDELIESFVETFQALPSRNTNNNNLLTAASTSALDETYIIFTADNG
jgi:hypothetical protein